MRFFAAFGMMLMLAWAGPARAQAAAPSLLRAAELQADVAVLRQAYEQMHPGLYRYHSKSETDAAFEQLRNALGHDQSLQQAYLAFSEFAATVRCGHTYANFFNQRKAVAAELFQSPTRVPFYFLWLEGQIVVSEDFTSQHLLPRGTKVLSINGHSSGDILRRLMTIARADGANDAKRVASLQVTGDSLYETFDVYFPMYFPQTGRDMALRVRRPGAKKDETLHVQALTYEQRIAPIKAREADRKGGDGPQFVWSYLPSGAAWLRMPTWALFDSKWDWKAWLNTHLDELVDKSAPALVIDLRGNEGGQDVGNVVLARLVIQDLRLHAMQRLVRYRKATDDLLPYLDTWDKSFADWGAQAVDLPQPWPTAPAEVAYLRNTKYDDDAEGDVIRAEGRHYSGKVLVLVDATNSSATFQFAQVVQQNRLGVLVGEPTGGSQRGINGGAFFFLRLPHSHIELDLPLIGAFPQKPMPDAGLMPDILVRPSAEDIAAGRDRVMARVERELSGRAASGPTSAQGAALQ